MKKLPNTLTLTALLIASVVFFKPQVTEALSGPTGVNQIRTEAGPSAGQITINWQRYHSDLTGYLIKYGTKPGMYEYSTGNLGNIVTYTVGSLTPGVRYYFRIYPYRNNVISDPASGEFSDVALNVPHTVVGSMGPVGQRKLMVAQGPAKGEVTLSWWKLYPDIDNYHVTYGLQPGRYIYGAQNIGSADANGHKSFTVRGLKSGTRYYFAVTPSRGGVSLYDSAEVSVVAP